MPVHDLGYRAWKGAQVAAPMRLISIAATGVRRSWQLAWLRRTVFLAWVPTFWFGFGLFAWEQSLLYPEWQGLLQPFFDSVPRDSDLAIVLQQQAEDPMAARHAVWAWLLQTFFRYSQVVVMVLVVGFVAPSLISQDIRSRAFLLYFSRPMNRIEYVVGKLFTLWFYLALVSTLPALTLYGLGALLSPQIEVLGATWDIPIRIIAASAVLMVPTSLLALALSSLTQESRYAAFAWFAVWILGWFTYGVLTNVEAFGSDGSSARGSLWGNLSFYHVQGRVQGWIFGFNDTTTAATAAMILVAIAVGSWIVLLRQVAAPMRA